MLTKLTLKNFKSFEYAEFDLGPVTTLIGTNASGKSNVRDALRILHGIARGYTLAEAIGEKWEQGIPLWKGIRGGTREMVYHGSKDRVCEIGVEFVTQCSDLFLSRETNGSYAQKVKHIPVEGRYNIEVEMNNDIHPKSVIRRESLYFNDSGQTLYHLEMDSELDSSNCIRIAVNSPNGQQKYKSLDYKSDRPFLGLFGKPSSYFSHAMIEGIGDIGIYGDLVLRAEAVIDLLNGLRFLDVSPESMRQPSLPGQTILSDRGENLSSVLNSICSEKGRKQILLQWLSELAPQDVTDFSFSEDQQGKVLLGLQEADGRVISAYSASDGTLRFLAMIAALLSPEPARLYFFEEVENGIHPSRLHLLMQLIEQRSTTDSGQLIMSTHSPQLLSYLSDRSRETASLIYRPSFSKSSHAIPILKVPHINEALQTQDVSEIHASGWFENVMEFMEGDDEEEGEV